MRFRPANISLINRRLYLPRLLLTLSSERQKTTQRFADVDRVTPYQLTVYRLTDRNPGISISNARFAPGRIRRKPELSV
jgi:hypothetical protein